MLAPTSEQIRSWSQVTAADWAGAGYAVAAPDSLDLRLAEAVAYVQKVTGRRFSAIADTDDDAPLMNQAVRMRVEQLVYMQVASAIQSATSDTYVTSFSVPGYSESRAVRPVATSSTTKRPPVNPWPLLDELLWLLMTPEMREFWLEQLTGVVAPAFAMTEVDWSGYGDVAHGWRQVDPDGGWPNNPSMWPGWGAL